jgi:hypothetical protein
MIFVPRALRNEHGVAFAAFAVVATATIGLASLGLGTGLLFLVHNEAQNAADAGALAGVEALFFSSSVNLEAGNAVKANALTGGIENPGAAFATDANIVSINTGNYDEATGFVSGLPPQNAVEVIVTTDVVPFFRAGAASTVTTRSVAVVCGPDRGPPDIPLIVGACEFTTPFCTEDSCLPTIQGAGATDPQVRWTSLSASASWQNVMRTFPVECQAYAECPFAQGATEELEEGDAVNVRSDLADSSMLLRCARACFTPDGPKQYLLPVVSCEIANPATVLGFATFLIDPATINPEAPNKGMTLVGRVPVPDESGGCAPFFGTGRIVLAE